MKLLIVLYGTLWLIADFAAPSAETEKTIWTVAYSEIIEENSKQEVGPQLQMIGNGKFYIQPYFKGDWYSGNAFCHSIGMQLIDVSTRKKHDEVVAAIRNAGYSVDSFWTSATEMGSDQFYWFNSGENLNFTNWAFDKPNKYKLSRHCMKLRHYTDFEWDDAYCGDQNKIMCEQPDPAEKKSLFTQNSNNSIIVGKYRVATSKANWYKAHTFCHSIGMNLIDVSTEKKNDEIAEVIKIADYSSDSFWTSGTVLGSNQFYWFNSSKKYNFTNWASGEPNNCNGDQHCMQVWAKKTNMEWADEACDKEKRIMCENSPDTKLTHHKSNDSLVREYRIASSKGNWHKSHAHCKSIDMNLIEIASKTKHDEVVKIIKDAGHGSESFWTAGTRLGSDQFYWFNSGEKYNFTNWASGQPNNWKGNQHCMLLWANKANKWADEACDVQNRIICEKSDSTKKSRPANMNTKSSVVVGRYLIEPSKVNWYKANAHCHSIGMHLIDVSTKEKQNEVVKIIKNAGYSGQSFWTSGNNNLGSKEFHWFNSGKAYNFENWVGNEPNNGKGNCMQLWAYAGYKWDDVSCNSKFLIMCEKLDDNH